jgi:hypothetical protein
MLRRCGVAAAATANVAADRFSPAASVAVCNLAQ